MNFKLIYLFLFILAGCGVKSSPIHPKGTDLPQYLDQVMDQTDESDKTKKPQDQKQN